MPNEVQIYNKLLQEFGDTLENASKDTQNNQYMTQCRKQVVNFDSFKEHVTEKLNLSGYPYSCDVLYRYCTNEWFLIEFKNGKLENENTNKGFVPKSNEFYDVIRKFLESLLLLTEELDQSIKFFRNSITFILVYNEQNNPFLNVTDSITKLGHKSEPLPMSYLNEILPNDKFNVSYFDQLYAKKTFVCSKEFFEREFIAKYL
jgi:hypothetical protein